jgi:heme exporter protein D
MNFDSFADFLAMGDHGFYVWLSYGVALVVIAANVLAVRRSRRKLLREIKAVQRRRQAAGQ